MRENKKNKTHFACNLCFAFSGTRFYFWLFEYKKTKIDGLKFKKLVSPCGSGSMNTFSHVFWNSFIYVFRIGKGIKKTLSEMRLYDDGTIYLKWFTAWELLWMSISYFFSAPLYSANVVMTVSMFFFSFRISIKSHLEFISSVHLQSFLWSLPKEFMVDSMRSHLIVCRRRAMIEQKKTVFFGSEPFVMANRLTKYPLLIGNGRCVKEMWIGYCPTTEKKTKCWNNYVKIISVCDGKSKIAPKKKTL